MKSKGIDVFLLTKPEDKYYLSGFESSNYFIVLTNEKDYLLTDFRYMESAQSKSGIFEIIEISTRFSVFDFLTKYDKMFLGIEEKNLTVFEYKELEKIFTAKQLVFAQEVIETHRMIKDNEEIHQIKRAAEITDYAFSHITQFVKSGLTEREIALELEFFMKKEGASNLSFEIIAASGERSSLPHGAASERIIQKGDFLTLDFGCIFDHYCSDMTRTLGVGAISDEQKEVYEIVKAAQTAALDRLRPGMKASEVDKIARDIIDHEGYGSFFGHGLGHGVGLEIHEAPRLSPACDIELKEGMVVTVEPGIYLPAKYGVRIEDLVVVSKEGIINLTSSNKELIIV